MSHENQMNLRVGGMGKQSRRAGTRGENPACRRSDLADWCVQGGALPAGLAVHIETCSACAAEVRRMSEVQAGLMLMCTQAAPTDLLARANGRGLRMLRRAARASAAVERLLRIRPDLSRWQRARLHLARVSVGAAAALLTLIVRTGVASGFEHTRQIGEQLVERHWEQWEKLDPPADWHLGPRSMT